MDQRHPCSLIALWDLCEVGVRSNLRCTPGPIQSVKQTHLTIFLCLLHDYAHDIVALLGGLAECKEGKKKISMLFLHFCITILVLGNSVVGH